MKPRGGEQLAHIPGERRAAKTSADPTDFDSAHDEGTRQHNAYRAESVVGARARPSPCAGR